MTETEYRTAAASVHEELELRHRTCKDILRDADLPMVEVANRLVDEEEALATCSQRLVGLRQARLEGVRRELAVHHLTASRPPASA